MTRFRNLSFSVAEIEQLVSILNEKADRNDQAIAEYLQRDDYDQNTLRDMFIEQGKISAFIHYMQHVASKEEK